YSLGVTLYELVTHRPIFEVDSPDVIITKILTTDPPSPRQLAPGLPRDLETIILKCLEKDAARRYAGARELADDLRAFREGRPIQARRPNLPERAARWARKHQRSTLVASVSALATLVLLVAGWVGWDNMRQARLGRISLTTSGENLVAEILDAGSHAVVPAFPVPTAEPVALPAGNYQLRLSSSGLLSETWPLEIKQGEQSTLPVQLRHRWLWSPMEINAAQYPEIEVATLGGSADLMQLTHRFVNQEGRPERRLRRIHGATGLPAWNSDLVFDAATLPAGRDLPEWQKLLASSGLSGLYEDSLLVPVQPDLNEDGTGDLVWISRTTPSVLALSGATGKTLWWHRSRSEAPAGGKLAPDDAQPSVSGSVVGRALAMEIDDDGILDFAVCLTSHPGTLRTEDQRVVRTPRQGWVEAVSGRTGQTLWRRSLGDPWPDVMNDSRAARRWHGQIRPLLVEEGSQPRVLLLVGRRLQSLDARTGADAA
ncbi:MAG TPA: hypothetical protein VLD18_08010, partial [Verrucomicrobiae bacterium]|nr:hypothetical protein [Verrucomicrobiae bacterium]